MGYIINGDLTRIASEAMVIARRFNRDVIQPTDLLLALHATDVSPVGQVLRRYVTNDFPLYEGALENYTKAPGSPEQPKYAVASIAMFRDAASVAEFYGRRQITPPDLLNAMICFEEVIKLLAQAGMEPHGFTALQHDVTSMLKEPLQAPQPAGQHVTRALH